ncbi:MAG: hypothetical protein OXD30_08505, partial [Bryobacterales bacterium]|nr:hypothetical protein [Bryobacterales bacterium]
ARQRTQVIERRGPPLAAAFDATTVPEPGRTGAPGRLRYSVSLPSLGRDFLKLTPTGVAARAHRSRSFRFVPGTTRGPIAATRPASECSTWRLLAAP